MEIHKCWHCCRWHSSSMETCYFERFDRLLRHRCNSSDDFLENRSEAGNRRWRKGFSSTTPKLPWYPCGCQSCRAQHQLGWSQDAFLSNRNGWTRDLPGSEISLWVAMLARSGAYKGG